MTNGAYIKSDNQSGGITVHTVHNYQSPAHRTLNANVIKDIDVNILERYKGKNIEVHSPMNDPEAYSFATQILSYSSSKKCNVEGVSQYLGGTPLKGQQVVNCGDKIVIQIGQN